MAPASSQTRMGIWQGLALRGEFFGDNDSDIYSNEHFSSTERGIREIYSENIAWVYLESIFYLRTF